jgi:hypothetical protein
MNPEIKSVLAALKGAVDETFGETDVVWVFADGTTKKVEGTFGLIDDKPALFEKRAGNLLQGDSFVACFAMHPDSVPVGDGGYLRVNGDEYKIMPFKKGDFETIIPLIRKQPEVDGSHRWL